MTYECRLFVRYLGLIWTKEELKLCQPRTLSPGERVSTRVKLQYKNSWALALVAGLQFSEDFYCQYLRSNQRSLGVFSPGLKPDRFEIDRSRGFEKPAPRTEVRGWHGSRSSLSLTESSRVLRRLTRTSAGTLLAVKH
jgi:hypothetical protein